MSLNSYVVKHNPEPPSNVVWHAIQRGTRFGTGLRVPGSAFADKTSPSCCRAIAAQRSERVLCFSIVFAVVFVGAVSSPASRRLSLTKQSGRVVGLDDTPGSHVQEITIFFNFIFLKVYVTARVRYTAHKICLLYTSPSPRD